MHFFNSVLPRVLGAILIALAFIAFSPLAFAGTGTAVSKTVGASATLSWTAPSSYTDGSSIASGTAITYQASRQPR